jgi:hypothetical protein
VKNIVWVKGSFISEQGEFERVAKDYSGDSKESYQENFKDLKARYARSSLFKLMDTDWRGMSNTDSWTTDTVKKMENAISRNNAPRDVGRIFYQYASLKVSSPIALRLGNGKLELIAGNTRLMGARVLGITPRIVIIKTDW